VTYPSPPNGAIDARFGIDAENFGSGHTSVTTIGPVTATNGNGIFAKASGGYVSVNAGRRELGVEHRHHRRARPTRLGTAPVIVLAGNVSGATGIEATNSGTGGVSVFASGCGHRHWRRRHPRDR
jgi:hypothetical protein